MAKTKKELAAPKVKLKVKEVKKPKAKSEFPSNSPEAHKVYNKRWYDRKKKEEAAKIERRQYKADWARKQKELEAQAKLDAYNKEFGYE